MQDVFCSNQCPLRSHVGNQKRHGQSQLADCQKLDFIIRFNVPQKGRIAPGSSLSNCVSDKLELAEQRHSIAIIEFIGDSNAN